MQADVELKLGALGLGLSAWDQRQGNAFRPLMIRVSLKRKAYLVRLESVTARAARLAQQYL